jgi:dihydrofolate reductase
MRKVIFGGANSLDGYFARKDHSVDWLMWNDEVAEIMKDFWPRFDCMMMGRKTYEVSLKMSPAGSEDIPNMYGDIKTYVFSRTLESRVTKGGTEILAEDAGEFVRKLKQQDGKDIMVMGGGELGNALLEAGVVDEIGFNIQPVLLGSGIPLFHEMSRQIDLELTESKQLSNGCVYVHYRVKN